MDTGGAQGQSPIRRWCYDSANVAQQPVDGVLPERFRRVGRRDDQIGQQLHLVEELGVLEGHVELVVYHWLRPVMLHAGAPAEGEG